MADNSQKAADSVKPITTTDSSNSDTSGRRRSSVDKYNDFMKISKPHDHDLADHKMAKPGVLGNLWQTYVKGKP